MLNSPAIPDLRVVDIWRKFGCLAEEKLVDQHF